MADKTNTTIIVAVLVVLVAFLLSKFGLFGLFAIGVFPISGTAFASNFDGGYEEGGSGAALVAISESKVSLSSNRGGSLQQSNKANVTITDLNIKNYKKGHKKHSVISSSKR